MDGGMLLAIRLDRAGSIRLLLLVPVALLVIAGFGCRRAEEAATGEQKGPAPYEFVLPLGLSRDSAYIPADNPLTEEKIRLGRRLYFDTILSLDRTISCASCHIPEKGFADPESFSVGIGGRKGSRQAPTVINRVFSGAQFWDGRASSLEEQATGPILNPVEMGMPDMEVVTGRLKADPTYVREFLAAFPPDGAITGENIGRAIASFERTIVSGNSPFDRFLTGDTAAMSEAARRGFALFRDENKGNCETCHVSFNFTDENYNNIGVGMDARTPDLGRYEISKLDGHQGAFKTPTLREIARTAPYMHDGSQQTLEEVLEFYNRGGHPNRWLSPKMKRLDLTPQEMRDIVEFLKALSGEVTWYGKNLP